MTPAQVNTALIIIVPALCLISLCASVFIWALYRLAAPESVEVNEDTL
jgi:Co/Zn/Cd efflux system component